MEWSRPRWSRLVLTPGRTIEPVRWRSFEVRRRAVKATVVFIGVLSLAGCVGFAPSDQLIAFDGAAVIRIDYASCTTRWPADPTGSREAVGIDPTGFHLMTWNVHKAKEHDWPQDFARLSKGQDLVLIQEAHLTPLFRSVLKENGYHWVMAHAFDYEGTETGVLTAAKVEPSATCLLRIPEPLIRVPKSSLLSRYRLGGSGEELWVANLHGINFTLGTGQFRHQLESLAEVLSQHTGPLILAGDFNNWSQRRSEILGEVTRRLQLAPLALTEDNRSRHLGYSVDLIFYRGVEVIDADSVDVSSSDHNPVSVKLSVPSNSMQR